MKSSQNTRVLGWTAATLTALTLGAGAAGAFTLTAQPQHAVQIQVEEGLPYNISEQTVQAALGEDSVPSWRPLTLRVTDKFITYGQIYRGAETEADLVLSIPTREADPEAEARFDGVGLNQVTLGALSDPTRSRYDIHEAFTGNRDLGHGPSAVVEAARTAGEETYRGLPRSMWLWIGLLTGGGALSLVALTLWARLRRQDTAVERTFRAGRLDVARVILDHEALEVSYLAVPEGQRPPGFEQAWRRLQEEALPLARREEGLLLRLNSTDPALREGLAADIQDYRDSARELAEQAHALEQSGRVHARLEGGDTVLDQIAQPLVYASRTLLARLAEAPRRTLDAHTSAELEAAHADLLGQIEAWGPAAEEATGDGAKGSADRIGGSFQQDWQRAEERLGRAAEAVRQQLVRYPGARDSSELAPLPGLEGTQALRDSLGLNSAPARDALASLARAHGAARALIGPHQDLDTATAVSDDGPLPAVTSWIDRLGEGAAPGGRRRREGNAWFHTTRGDDRPRLSRLTWLVAAGGVAVLTLLPALIIAESVTRAPGWELTGDQPVDAVQIDGPELGDLSEEGILRFVDGAFVEPVDVTVAVRDAESYLDRTGESTELSYELDPAATVEALWRLKSEFPEKVDERTGELLPGTVIVPVMVWEEDVFSVLYPITGAVSEGERSRLAPHAYARDSTLISDGSLVDVRVGSELESVGRGLQSNGADRPEASEGVVAVVLWVAFTAGLLLLLALVETLAGLSVGAGRFGRGSAALRRVKESLEKLMVGLDESRLSAVAVLGAGPAGSPQEAEQRLYERSLVAAWREVEQIESLSVAERTRRDTQERIEALQRAVAQILARESDVQARADEVLRQRRD